MGLSVGRSTQLAQMQECWLWQQPRAASCLPDTKPDFFSSRMLCCIINIVPAHLPACLSLCLLVSPPHTQQSVTVVDQDVPDLTKQQIIQIKSAAMEQRRWVGFF